MGEHLVRFRLRYPVHGTYGRKHTVQWGEFGWHYDFLKERVLTIYKIREWYAEQMGSVSNARASHAVEDNSPSAAASKP
jgi:hypothetical protein